MYLLRLHLASFHLCVSLMFCASLWDNLPYSIFISPSKSKFVQYGCGSCKYEIRNPHSGVDKELSLQGHDDVLIGSLRFLLPSFLGCIQSAVLAPEKWVYSVGKGALGSELMEDIVLCSGWQPSGQRQEGISRSD